MKTLRCLSAVCCLAIAPGANVLAQKPPVPPPPAGVPVPPAPPGEVRDVEKVIERAHREAAEQLASAHAAQAEAHNALGKVKTDLRWLTGGSKASRVLVVPAGEPEPEMVAHLEEDLAVMGRILEKSVDSKDRQATALGVDLLTFAGPSGAQHLYVGGHGAIFTLRVKFPLSAPPAQTTENEPDEEISSAWEEAKRDVFGPSERHLFKEFTLKDREDYDARKVEKLKSSIIDSLKNGTHIRHLKPDERVTVVVTSGGSGIFEAHVSRMGFDGGGRGGSYGGYGAYARSGGPKEPSREKRRVEAREKARPETVLTIQARKSDIDAFAKGDLDSDAFRKKVTVMTY